MRLSIGARLGAGGRSHSACICACHACDASPPPFCDCEPPTPAPFTALLAVLALLCAPGWGTLNVAIGALHETRTCEHVELVGREVMAR